MDCWEFHHVREGRVTRWFWRVVDRTGAVLRESGQRFESSVEAFQNAQRNGFDRMVHEWYVAKPAARPCTKVAGRAS